VNAPSAPVTVDALSKLGVPVVVLAIVLFQLIPRIDHGIAVADRVEGQLNIIAASCDLRPR